MGSAMGALLLQAVMFRGTALMDHPSVLILVKITIFTIMLAIGVNKTFQQLTSLWRRPALLVRSLLAVIVFVPLLVFFLLKLIALPREVTTGLALLAAAPGAPLTTIRSKMAGGEIHYSASLQLTLALLAVLVTPLTLGIFNSVFDLDTKELRLLEVAGQVALVQFLPVSIGLLIRKFAQKFAVAMGKLLNIAGNGLLLLLVILVIVPGFREIYHIGGLPILAIVITAAVSLAVGHLLGGPSSSEHSALAVACIARNIGLALFIAALNETEKTVIPTYLTYMILGVVVTLPYSVWIKRRKRTI